MKALKLNRKYTFQEYLELERSSTIKHEYHAGWIVAMAGGRLKHGTIVHNTSTAINNALGNKDCIVSGDVKIKIDSINRALFPDLFLICGEPQFYKNHEDIVTNPTPTLQKIAEFTDIEVEPLVNSITSDLARKDSHIMAGNALRKQKSIRLKLDTEWYEKMGQKKKKIFYAIAGRTMTSYGYKK